MQQTGYVLPDILAIGARSLKPETNTNLIDFDILCISTTSNAQATVINGVSHKGKPHQKRIREKKTKKFIFITALC